jgi:hypothetical protein
VSPVGVEPHFEYVGPGNRPNEPEAVSANDGTARQTQAATSGNSLAFAAVQAPSGSPSAGEYVVASREADGWVTHEIIPPQSAQHDVLCLAAYPAAFTPDLSRWVLGDGVGQPGSHDKENQLNDCGRDDPSLVADEPEGFQNLFVTEDVAGPYQLVDPLSEAPSETAPRDAWFQGGSEDLTRVIFDESAQLTSEALPVTVENPNRPNNGVLDLYESTGGVVRLVTFSPSGTPVTGALAGGYEPEGAYFNVGAASYAHSVSADGSRVLFVSSGNLYDRLNAFASQSPVTGGVCTVPADACTVQVDLKQAGGSGSSGGGKFLWASTDGSKVFFMDCSRLVEGSTAVSTEGCEHEEEPEPSVTRTVITGNDLYEYNLDEPVGKRLKDLSVDHHGGDVLGADVQGVSGASADGSVVYFVADGVLSEAANGRGEKAVSGEPNLYVEREHGTPVFIARLDEPVDWQEPEHAARVTSAGEFLAFNSKRRLTAYNNTDSVTGNPDSEIFLYDLATNSLACVSCNPNDTPPTGGTRLEVPVRPWFGGTGPFAQPGRLQNNLSESGQVFFSTEDRLLPGAVNGLSNVYEWENGQVYLLSSGSGDGSSYFYEASPDGSNVFFVTSQELPSGRPSPEFAVYDARVEGGFEPAGAVLACEEGEVCRAAPERFGGLVAGSEFGSGVGNVGPAAAVGRVSVKLLSKSPRSRVVVVRVVVPGGGRLVLSGGSVVTARRSLGGAGSYTVRVDLTKKAWASLRRHHKLKFGLRARFVTSAGVEVSSTVSLAVK